MDARQLYYVPLFCLIPRWPLGGLLSASIPDLVRSRESAKGWGSFSTVRRLLTAPQFSPQIGFGPIFLPPFAPNCKGDMPLYYSHCIHNERVADSDRFPRVMPRLRPYWACIDALRASAIKRVATQTNEASSHGLPESTAGFSRPSLLPWWRLTTSHLCRIPVVHGSRGYRP